MLTDFSILETGVAIICACLPTFRPLLADCIRPFNGIKQWYGSHGLWSPKNNQQSAFHSGGGSQFHKIGNRLLNNGQLATFKSETHPLNSIAVHNVVEVV